MTEATAIVGDFFPEYMYLLPQTASKFKSKVQIKVRGITVDAKSLLMIMSIGLSRGTEITIRADGPDEAEAVKQLMELGERNDLYGWKGKFEEFRKQREAALRERLKQYTDDENILANVDKVAFNQSDLISLINKGIDEIYLCNNRFDIPLRQRDKTYIGLGETVAVIRSRSKKPIDFDALNIKFKNISFEDYKKVSQTKKSVKATQTNTNQEVKPMAKKERFALMMEDGAQVRNIDDLKAHFDVGSVVRDFSSGKLLTWLEDRYYDDEADAIRAINDNDACLGAKLCKIFGVETPEEIERRLQRLNRLKQFTTDEKILSKVDCVAFDQEDLADLLDEGVEEIYLCENRFVIPLRMKNKVYIGVGKAVAVIGNKKQKDFAALNIKFKNVAFDNDKKTSQTNSTPEIKSTAKNATSTEKPKRKRKPATQNPISNTISGHHYEITTTIVNKTGMHERPSAVFVQTASKFKSKIQVKAKGKTVDAKSILMIMSMGLVFGTEITIVAEGEDAQEAIKALEYLIDSKFGEE